jgi:ATP-dependent RNA helicase DDX19/DBP5
MASTTMEEKFQLSVLDHPNILDSLDDSEFNDMNKMVTKDWLVFLQVLLFSATFDDTVKNFATRIVAKKEYNEYFVKKEELSLEAVKQYKVHCPDELAKIEVIKDYIFELGENVGQTIIFVRTRNSAKMLHKSLVDFGYEVTSIQGALQTEERDAIIKEFKDGLTQVLISTDVLSRGFDQDQVLSLSPPLFLCVFPLCLLVVLICVSCILPLRLLGQFGYQL